MELWHLIKAFDRALTRYRRAHRQAAARIPCLGGGGIMHGNAATAGRCTTCLTIRYQQAVTAATQRSIEEQIRRARWEKVGAEERALLFAPRYNARHRHLN